MCRLLGGLPLAIELAAARARLLGPAELCRRLADSLPTLVGGARDAPARHRSLHATVEWSVGLLDADSRACLARLGLFEGSFSLGAAEVVAGRLDALETLLGHHLISSARGSGGSPRFALHPAVRAFARAELASSGNEDATRLRCAQYFCTLVAAEEPRGQASLLDRLDADHADMCAALTFLQRRGDAEAALRLACGLSPLRPAPDPPRIRRTCGASSP